MLINKITVGFVIQTFDTEKRQYVHQEFIAGDEVSYENRIGEIVNKELINNPNGSEPYLPFAMIQPRDIREHEFNDVTKHCIHCNCDEDDAYVGGIPCNNINEEKD